MDALRPGILGAKRDAFAARYCDRRLVPCTAFATGQTRYKWSNAGEGDGQREAVGC